MPRRAAVTQAPPHLERIIRRRDLPAYVGLRSTQIDILRKAGKFPQGFALSERAVGWLESDIIAWQQARAGKRTGEAAGTTAHTQKPCGQWHGARGERGDETQ